MELLICRYCSLAIPEQELATTHGYWGGSPFLCHKQCKDAGIKQEAYDCQLIDADCNDCKHFKRGKLLPPVVSFLKRTDSSVAQVTHQPNVFNGHCLKFDRPTLAQPNKWSGLECFEHRRVELGRKAKG